MSEEDELYYIYPHDDISAAYNALLALEGLDIAMYGGKRMEARIRRNALKIIDKALQDIADDYEDKNDDDE
jgi:hypothetical protein